VVEFLLVFPKWANKYDLFRNNFISLVQNFENGERPFV